MKGIVFDIKEFAVYDGPGIRSTVFMKGCPLRCRWCHNPEGLSTKPQLMVSVAACVRCGRCTEVCSHKDGCIACGDSITHCQQGLRRIAGYGIEPAALAEKLRKSAVFEGGGVTFSGGEPMLQWKFVKETCSLMDGVHRAIETSGYCADEDFAEMMETMDFIMMDIKHTDDAEHKKWTGVGNARILRHLEMLKRGDTPFVIRVPLIPGVNDSYENLVRLAGLLSGSKNLVRVELLPYHQTAGAKYSMAGMEYDPGFDTVKVPEKHMEPFAENGIDVMVMA